MRLERVGRNPGVVPPHLVQQHVTRHDTFGRAVQELEDVRFLLRQADFAVILGDQHLDGWFERVWPKGEHGVFGLFMLAQLGADASEQYREFERLADVVVGARIETQGSCPHRCRGR